MTFITLSALMLWALVAFVALTWWQWRWDDDGGRGDDSPNDPDEPEPDDDWESWWLLDAEERERRRSSS